MVNAIAQPYRFYLLSRLQKHVDALTESDRENVLEMLRSCGMGKLMEMRLSRDIGSMTTEKSGFSESSYAV